MARAIPVDLPRDPVAHLATLFDLHHARLYRLARRLAPSADDALDLVQETFLRAARFPDSVPLGIKDEEAWLVRVLINIRRDQWRKAFVRNRLDNATFGDPPCVRGGRDSETALIARVAVWRSLDMLLPRRRAIVIMHELEELPIPTIASLLGISAITVRWHLSKGRRELARVLRAYEGGFHGKS